MKIKEVCERCGLTDKTVRYYIGEKLITPFYTENYLGRKSFYFSESDLETLKNIATLRAFGFSIEEIKMLSSGKIDVGEIIQAVKKRAENNLEESSKRVNFLSRINLSDETGISDLAKQLSSPNMAIEEAPTGTNIKKTVLSFLGASAVFLAVWLPIVLSLSILIVNLFTITTPIIQADHLIYTLLSLLPSLATLLITKRIKGPRKMVRVILTSLCVVCIPLAALFSSSSVVLCEHSYKPYRTVVEATCTNDGEMIEKCETCSNILTKKIAMIPHLPVAVEGVEPTCGKDGLTSGSYCSLCQQTLTEQVIISATNIHTPVMDAARAADCENVGLSEGSHCLDCGKVLVEQITSPALGHMYTHQIVEPTCGEGGYTVHQCGCGSIYIDNYTRETVYHEFVEYSTSPSKSVCKACGLKVVSHGNADGTAEGGNDSVKYYLTGADTFSYGKTLVIYGSGDMPDYTIDDPPWSYFKDQIKTIIIEEGITSIGEDAFSHEKYSNTGKLIIRSKHLANINIKKNFAGISEILCEIIFDY
ncbi:MAG: MerR family transcriptional regulator [Clostridia bacterium]|nr:MerR family transcriptional regulator [Clostridia bacterium]